MYDTRVRRVLQAIPVQEPCDIKILFSGVYRTHIVMIQEEHGMTSGEELLELRKSTGMNRREFAEYFEIPYRTVQDWELGNRRMPYYLLQHMVYKVDKEKLAKKHEGR